MNKKLRNSARGQSCTLRIPSVCNHNPETVVLCHVSTKRSSGMGAKNHDDFAFFGCSACHTYQEAHRSEPEMAQYTLEAMDETNQIWHEMGLK